MKTLLVLLKSENGAAAIEYAFLAALVSIIAIIGMSIVGTNIGSAFSSVASALSFANL